MEEINEQLNKVLNGELNAHDAHQDVQTWLKVSIYNLAHIVASHKTKEQRAKALDIIKQDNPAFYDDVKEQAKIIYKKYFT